MAQRYLGQIADTREFKIQELIRVIDATISEMNPSGLPSGQNCMSIIKFLSTFPGFDQFVSQNFRQHVNDQVAQSFGKDNVREHVKKILMYPTDTYLPWSNFDVESELLNQIQSDALNIKFRLRIVEGKVYGVCLSEQTLNDVVFDKLKDRLPGLKPNVETCHITVVNSNIVADIGQSIVDDFLKQYDFEFSITTGAIKSTFSQDWSRFSECFVIEVQCDYIDRFLNDFNQSFAKKINVSKHITFAIKPRSLWN